MKSRDPRRLLERAAEAQAVRSETKAQRGPAQLGDVFSLPSTAELTVLWAWIQTKSDESGDRAVLVAADLHPWIGSADVLSPPEASCGVISLRCAIEVEVPVEGLEEASRAGSLLSQTLQVVFQKRVGLADGTLRGSLDERDTDEDPEYQTWLEEGPRQAQALLQRDSAVGRLTTDAFSVSSGPLGMPPVEARQIVDESLREEVDPGLLQLLQHVHRSASQPHLGADDSALGQDFRDAGWGLVLPSDEPPETRSVLQPLIDHRKHQLGEDRVKILDHEAGEDWRSWLARHGVAPGFGDVSKVPYFLLIVASPRRISFEFQHVLGVEYGTGRLHFETPVELARYVKGLVSREQVGAESPPRRAVVFAPTPSSAGDALHLDVGSVQNDWQVQRLEGAEASRDRLLEAMGDPEHPLNLLMAVTLGAVRPPGGLNQQDLEGALLCHRDETPGELEAMHRFAASDVDRVYVGGSVLVLLAACSAGSPDEGTDHPPRIAALPQALLAHPQGGAGAVLGRIGPGWWQDGASPDPWLRELFEDLTAGRPVGRALQQVRTRYATLATELAAELNKVQMGARHDAARLTRLWGERNNLRDLVVLGDPAACLTRPEKPPLTPETPTARAEEGLGLSSTDAHGIANDDPLPSDITVLLEEWSDGDREALDRLIPLVFDQLRAMAHNYFRKEASNQTLQTTALVHEVYLRLQGRRTVQWRNQSHFFGSLAAMIRQILVDRARRRKSAKRGGGVRPLPFDDLQLAVDAPDPELLALDETLEKLKKLSPRQHQVVELKFFMGLTLEEIAKVLDVAKSTVIKDWANARAFLLWQLNQDVGGAAEDDGGVSSGHE